jgi:excisionase family DNA binding protein
MASNDFPYPTPSPGDLTMARPSASSALEIMPLLTVKQVCDRTQLSESTIRRAIKANELSHSKFGHVVRVAETDLRRFLNRCHSNLGR